MGNDFVPLKRRKMVTKTLRSALCTVLLAGLTVPLLAQDNFPDVPENHWAYEALGRLKKDGLLVGYPDGLFRGNRPASRYELAVAIHATYVHLKSITDGLQSEIDDLKGGDAASQLQALKDAVAQLQDELNAMKGWGSDIDNLKKLADEFQKELASLGVDVEGLKKDIGELAKRVGVLEAHHLPFDIHGDTNFFLYAGNGSGNLFGISTSGRPVGAQVVTTPAGKQVLVPVGFEKNSTVYQELVLKLTSNDESSIRWHGDISIGNLLQTSTSGATTAAYSSQSHNGNKVPHGAGPEALYIQDLAVDFGSKIAGEGFNAELGRTGYEIDPYIYRRIDVLPYYFVTDFWGDGKWYFDGGILGFHLNGAKLDVFGGKQSDQTDTAGTNYQPMLVGALGHPFTPGKAVPSGITNSADALGITVDEQLGLNLGVPLGANGNLDLAYIEFESNSGSTEASVTTGFPAANRADVYGGVLSYKLERHLKLKGGYSASDLRIGDHDLTSKDNYSWHGSLAYDSDKWGLEAGYRQIEPQFGAPGDWGRIGIWWNPTDIEGPWAAAHVNLTDKLGLKVSGEWDSGTNTKFSLPTSLGGGTSTGLANDDTLYDYKAELDYRFCESWSTLFSIDFVNWHFPGQPNNPYESWYTVGLRDQLSHDAFINFVLQYSSFDGEGIVDPYSNPRLAGYLLTTQLTVKF